MAQPDDPCYVMLFPFFNENPSKTGSFSVRSSFVPNCSQAIGTDAKGDDTPATKISGVTVCFKKVEN